MRSYSTGSTGQLFRIFTLLMLGAVAYLFTVMLDVASKY